MKDLQCMGGGLQTHWAPARWAKSASRCTASSASKETSPASPAPPGEAGAADSRHRSKAAPVSHVTAPHGSLQLQLQLQHTR